MIIKNNGKLTTAEQFKKDKKLPKQTQSPIRKKFEPIKRSTKTKFKTAPKLKPKKGCGCGK